MIMKSTVVVMESTVVVMEMTLGVVTKREVVTKKR